MFHNAIGRFQKICFFSTLAVTCLLTHAAQGQVDPYAPQPMLPPEVDYTYQSGRTEGMVLFPASPIPGQPGVDPSKGRKRFLHNQWLPYPGSVEHYKMFNYRLHPVPIYNHRTLVKNFAAGDLSGVTKAMQETFAEPVEYLQRYGKRAYTGELRDPVPVVRLKPGQRLTFKLGSLPTSMYAVRMIGVIEPANVTTDPQSLVLDMTINDGDNGKVSHYVLRQRAADNFLSLGEFYFHVEDARHWEVSIGLHEDSSIDLLVHNVDVHDVLGEMARKAGKTRSIQVTPESLEANWQSPGAANIRSRTQASISLALAELKKQHPDLSDEALKKLWRQQKDDDLWNAMPPRNAGYISRYYNQVMGTMANFPFNRFRPDPVTQAKLDAAGYTKESQWKLDITRNSGVVAPWRMVWEKPDGEKLIYTLQDLLDQKPLPGLPVTIPPWGLRTEDDKQQAYHYFPIMYAVGGAFDRITRAIQGTGAKPYVAYGDLDAAHDQALLLVRLAYELPSYQLPKAINASMAPENVFFNRTNVIQYRERNSYQQFELDELASVYDMLFPFIQGNQELADAVGRHIKWVKTPQDVITLLDTYVLQFGARQAMYMQFFYNHVQPMVLSKFAAYQTDPSIATPWVKTAFEWTWEYPYPYAGIEDYMYLATQRDGTNTLGSVAYNTDGSAAAGAVPYLNEYIADGGNKQYDLSDAKKYPRLAQFPNWLIESRAAGLHGLQIGDVGAQNIPYAQWNPQSHVAFNQGFLSSGDPRFAWIVANFGKRRGETHDQWETLLSAAKTVKRNPFLSQSSRVLADWGSILEANTPADDFRLKSAARLRIGVGYGHAHSDTLDLGLWALGLNMSGDMGGRSGYNFPSGLDSHSHNLVTIDQRNWMGHAWARQLSDFDTLQYTNVDTLRGGHYSRQIALVELDRGKASPDFPKDSSLSSGEVLGKDITNAASYLVDFSRTQGGKEHTYNFHGPQEDAFTVNIKHDTLSETDEKKLAGYRMPGEQWVGTLTDPTLTATWRMTRESKEMVVPKRGTYQTYATESRILGKNYDADSPRKFLRVHVLGQQGMHVLSGVNVQAANKARNGEWFRRLHVARPANEGQPASSLFAAVWEPYAGDPFITDVKFEGDGANYASFAAVHVNTKQGDKDLVFSDAVKPELRTLQDGLRVHADFAYVSNDATGLRQISMTAGREIHTPTISITTQAATHQAHVVSLDYYNNVATLDQALPASLTGRFFEVGVDGKNKSQPRWSNFEALAVKGKELTWRKGADAGTGIVKAMRFWQEPVKIQEDGEEAEAEPGDSPYNPKNTNPSDADTAATSPATVAPVTPEAQPVAAPIVPDWWTQLKATNDQAIIQLALPTGTVHGRTDQLALTTQDPQAGAARVRVAGSFLIVDAGELRKLNIKSGDRIRLYEIAVGDTFRTPTQVDLKRISPTTFTLTTDVALTLGLPHAKASYSTDAGRSWQVIPASADGKRQWQLTADLIGQKGLQIQLH